MTAPDHLHLHFNAKYLPALRTHVATKDVRYYQKMAHAEPHPRGGVLLVATDGYRMIVCHDPKGFCTTAVQFDVPKANAKAVKDGSTVTIESPGTATTDCSREFVRIMVDGSKEAGRYPQWRQIIPNELPETGMTGDFNADYLADLAKAAAPFDQFKKVRVLQADADRSAVALFANPDMLAIVMPTHGPKERTFPEWLVETPVTTEKAT